MPYTLPKNLHVTLNPIVGAPQSAVPADNEPLVHTDPDSTGQYVIEQDNDSDSDMEEVALSTKAKPARPLKSMTQFAEANKLAAPEVREGSDDMLSGSDPIPTRVSSTTWRQSAGISETPSSRRSSRPSTRSTSKKSTPAPARDTKKRTRNESVTDSEFSDGDDSDDVHARTSTRRTRGQQSALAPRVSVPKSDRVLRSRVLKSSES